MSVRERLVALAKGVENLGGAEPTRAAYVAFLASDDPADHNAWATAYFADPTTSSCALTVRALWRKMGLTHPLLGAYYLPGRVGHAIEDVKTIAREHGAWIEGAALATYEPQIADVPLVWVPGYGNTGHVFTLIEVAPSAGGGTEIVSIDGGEPVADKHGVKQETIARRFRTWKRKGSTITDLPKFGGTAKQVVGVVDVSRLPFPVPQSELQSCPTERAPTSER
jgi:hypothetical protein